MSEPTDRQPGTDFRGGRGAAKRHDETVVLSADQLAELTSQAMADAGPPASPTRPAVVPPAVDDADDSTRRVLLVAAAVIAVLVVLLLAVWVLG